MNETNYTIEQPSLVRAIAILTLLNGIVNIFWGLAATFTVTASIILICLAPMAILPTILGIFEIIYAAKLLNNPPQPVQPSNAIAIFEVMCILAFNVFSMIVGILALVFYNDPQVKEYFARLNGMIVPTTPKPPVPPTPPAPPALAPAKESESSTESAPEGPEKPKKPRSRKVASEKSDESSERNAPS